MPARAATFEIDENLPGEVAELLVLACEAQKLGCSPELPLRMTVPALRSTGTRVMRCLAS
jgi:hypothetical protein